MFTQLRSAVEQLAQQAAVSENPSAADASPRKSSLSDASSVRKSTLEERLRRAANSNASVSSTTRGRPESSSAATARLSSQSPMARGAPAADRPSSRTASPARTTTTSRTEVSSKPPSRTASPAPAARAARANALSSSRAASPLPATRTTRASSLSGSAANGTRSRSASPAPTTRTPRAVELASRTQSRSSSPVPTQKNRTPLRKEAVNLKHTPLAASPSVFSTTDTEGDRSFETAQEDPQELDTASTPANDLAVEEQSVSPEKVSVVDGEVADSSPIPEVSDDKDSVPQNELPSSPDTVASPPPVAPAQEVEEGVKEETAPQADAEHSNGEALAVEKPLTPPPTAESVPLEPVQDSTPAVQEVTEKAEAHQLSNGTQSPDATVVETVVPTPSLPEAIPMPATPIVDRTSEVESLQARLKQVEQRFSDVSTSFKRLQAEKMAADAILKEHSPLQSIDDANALRQYFTDAQIKDQVFQEEIKRLNNKLEAQEDRLEALQNEHKSHADSRSNDLVKLKTQLDETEALFEAAQRATSTAEQVSDKYKDEISRLEKELEASKSLAKEEEEKRVKAISLLKTVRQKLVKAEKDRDDALKEMATAKEKERGDKDKEEADRLGLQRELEARNTAHAKAMIEAKSQHEKDLASLRDRYEQEISALRGQAELELATTKSSYTKELNAKTSHIATLENSLNGVTRDKNAFFDQLQLRQAEVESSQGHLESLQHQNTELQFQLREANDRLSLLKEEYAELLRESDSRSREHVTSPDEIARMVAAAEAKYEVRMAEMKRNISILEKERSESEADWSRKHKEKVKELEDMKRMLGSANRTRENEENTIATLRTELQAVEETIKGLQRENDELPILKGRIEDLQRSSKEHEEEIKMKIHVLEKQVEEQKTREIQAKQSNKVLRDELRKVQSSAALLERQRNPGVGYWTNRVEGGSNGNVPMSAMEPRTSTTEAPSRTSSPAPSTATMNKAEEEVNLEYLRNVIFQFLEHKEMRPNLVRVLSIILHFTPQETRRLVAKVGS